MKKHLSTILLVALVAAISIGATLAYLTDTDEAVNTFTVGNVEIELDEAKVDEYGTKDPDADRVAGNNYKLIPGHSYVKDPTVTVKEGSEKAYVRMLVTFNYSAELDDIFEPNGADLITIFNGYDSTKWKLNDVTEDVENNLRTYEFRYKEAVTASDADVSLEALFEGFKVPENITKEQLATLVTLDGNGVITDQFKITVVAHAIQADGFADADAAWAKFAE